MQVEFLKDCPWSYRFRGVTKHKKGQTAQVVDSEALQMIDAGYAEECKPKYKPLETKAAKRKKKKTKKVKNNA